MIPPSYSNHGYWYRGVVRSVFRDFRGLHTKILSVFLTENQRFEVEQDTLTSDGLLGKLYAMKNEFDVALKHEQRALDGRESTLGAGLGRPKTKATPSSSTIFSSL